jgi:CRP/FNR family transcriptional regulator, cyclic AMP receptor protein
VSVHAADNVAIGDDPLLHAPLFAALDPQARDDLRLAAQPFAVQAGDLVFRQGDDADGLYIIAQGRIAIAARTPGDDEIAVTEAGPGSIMGELSLLDGGKRSATARAIDDASGLFIGLSRVRALAAIGRPAAFALTDQLRSEVIRRFRATIAGIAAYDRIDPASLRALGTGSVPAPASADGLDAMLRGLVRFASLNMAKAGALTAIATRIDAPRGTVIGAAGAPADALHIVLRGAMRTGIARPGGFEAIAVHGPGECAGIAAMADGGPYPLTIEVAETAILLRIESADLNRLKAEDSDLAHMLFDVINRQLVRDLRRANRHLARAEGLKRFGAGVNA